MATGVAHCGTLDPHKTRSISLYSRAKGLDQLIMLARTGETALAAWDLLRHAEAHPDTRVAWILGATAAEVGAKEILTKMTPDIELVLKESPSPPVGKLYGSLLEHYCGERSPYVNKLNNGAAVRNKLVHRPSPPAISSDELRNYLRLVASALRHVLGLYRRKRRLPLPKDVAK